MVSKLKWFVIKTKPCAENDVKLRLTNAQFEVFYPRIKSIVRSRNKPTSRLKSLFPSYIFARFDVSKPEVFHMIKYTRGVHRILGSGDIPTPIPDEIVKVIKERVNKEGVVEQRLVFKKGDQVRIRTGPLQDLVGILEKPVSASGRVRVLLEIMKKVVKAEIPCSDIERAES